MVINDKLSRLCWVRFCGTLLRSQSGFLAVRKKLISSLGRPRHLVNRYGLSGTIKVRERHISAGWRCHWRRLARRRHGDGLQRRQPGKLQLAEEDMAVKAISPRTFKKWLLKWSSTSAQAYVEWRNSVRCGGASHLEAADFPSPPWIRQLIKRWTLRYMVLQQQTVTRLLNLRWCGWYINWVGEKSRMKSVGWPANVFSRAMLLETRRWAGKEGFVAGFILGLCLVPCTFDC